MKPDLDDHGQPDPSFNLGRRIDRTIHEMLGVCKGLIADGVVTEGEAVALQRWMKANPHAGSIWPGTVLAERLGRIFEDGRIDAEEQEDLAFLVQQIVGRVDDQNPATRLPIDDPLPGVQFDGRLFVFTGKFYYGRRIACESAVARRGGQCASSITKRVNYLVIGELGSRDWAHTSFGRKIQKAVGYRSEGVPIRIVPEEHWTEHLGR